MQLVNTRFREHVSVKDQGSITLGFLDATLVVAGISVEVNDMVVRLTTDGLPSISLPRRDFVTAQGKRSKAILRFDESTYGALVRAAFVLPAVARAIAKSEIARAKSA